MMARVSSRRAHDFVPVVSGARIRCDKRTEGDRHAARLRQVSFVAENLTRTANRHWANRPLRVHGSFECAELERPNPCDRRECAFRINRNGFAAIAAPLLPLELACTRASGSLRSNMNLPLRRAIVPKNGMFTTSPFATNSDIRRAAPPSLPRYRHSSNGSERKCTDPTGPMQPASSSPSICTANAALHRMARAVEWTSREARRRSRVSETVTQRGAITAALAASA